MSVTAFAGVTERAEINYKRGTFNLTFIALIEGSSDAVRAIVTDYERMHQLNKHITESRVIERYGPNTLKRALVMKYCILIFCFDMDFVENVEETPDTVTTTIIPEESTFKDGIAVWRIESVDATHTRMSVIATNTPRFWIPPLIGPMILKRAFLKEARATGANLERIAKTTAASRT